MKKKRILFSVIAILGLVISCNLPSAAPADSVTETPSATPGVNSGAAITDTPTLTATNVAVITDTPSPTATACSPTVIANTPVNVRSGPGVVYDIIGALVQGGGAIIAGKNYESTWWYINFAGGDGGHGWVGASVVTASCVPATLAIIAAPPTPTPTNTPKPTATYTPAPAAFAVTSVNYAVSKWSLPGFTDCPRITASITVNAAGSVDYHWIRSDGPGPGGTLVFGAAGTQAVTADWSLGSFWAPAPDEWMGIYIDTPNHQNFGHAVMPACTLP